MTGYRGRTGIYELIEIDEALREAIHAGEGEQALLVSPRTQPESTPTAVGHCGGETTRQCRKLPPSTPMTAFRHKALDADGNKGVLEETPIAGARHAASTASQACRSGGGQLSQPTGKAGRFRLLSRRLSAGDLASLPVNSLP